MSTEIILDLRELRFSFQLNFFGDIPTKIILFCWDFGG
jgi:hypothetical protein